MYLKGAEKLFRLLPTTLIIVLSVITIGITYYLLEHNKNRDIELLKQKIFLQNKFDQKELLNNINFRVQKNIEQKLLSIQRDLREHTFKIIGGLKHQLNQHNTSTIVECLDTYELENLVEIAVISQEQLQSLDIVYGENKIEFLSQLIFAESSLHYKNIVLQYLTSQGRYNLQEWRDDLLGTLRMSFFDILIFNNTKYYIGTFSKKIDIQKITKAAIQKEIDKSTNSKGYYFWFYDLNTHEGYNFENKKKRLSLDTILQTYPKEKHEIFLDQLLSNTTILQYKNSFITHDKLNKLSIVLEFNTKIELDTSNINLEYKNRFIIYIFFIVICTFLIIILVRHFSFIIKVQLDARALKKKVEEEVKKNREKDRILVQQSKLAAMGEMLGNIAHQWRQPLNNVSLFLQFIESNYKNDKIDSSLVEKYFKKSFVQINYMSQTIDDFRNFYKPSKEKSHFQLSHAIDGAIDIIAIQLENENITLEKEIEDFSMNTYENELKQAILNILNNAQHAIKEKKNIKSFDSYIKIKVKKQDNTILIDISNNGGAIDKKVLPKIFEPYFTTKFESQGTGVGLYMTKSIIEVNLQGRIEVENFTDGVSFKILLPYNLKE
jgi:signal transduction histidine kinase